MTEHVNTIFSLFLEKRLPSSVLIHGKKGVGKSYLVGSIAKKILQTTNSPDLLTLAEPISIDDVRRGIDFSVTSPANSYKILVFDGIDTMSNGAINAMLKLVEEPPVSMYILLVAWNLYNIPKTICSRCMKIYVKRPSFNDFVRIVTSNRNDLSDETLKYLYNALEGDINATNSIRGGVTNIISSGKPYFGDLLDLLAVAPDDTLVKIVLFELAQKAKLADHKGQLYFLEKIDFLNREYAKIKKYNLSEANTIYAIVNSLNL